MPALLEHLEHANTGSQEGDYQKVTVRKKTVILNTYPKIAPAAVPGSEDAAWSLIFNSIQRKNETCDYW
jgi:hypothetical protein